MHYCSVGHAVFTNLGAAAEGPFSRGLIVEAARAPKVAQALAPVASGGCVHTYDGMPMAKVADAAGASAE